MARAAAGETRGSVQMAEQKAAKGFGSSLVSANFPQKDTRMITVPVVRLDELVHERGLLGAEDAHRLVAPARAGARARLLVGRVAHGHGDGGVVVDGDARVGDRSRH